jgi:hypothetical protein
MSERFKVIDLDVTSITNRTIPVYRYDGIVIGCTVA